MRKFIAAAVAGVVFVVASGSTFAFDPSTGPNWRRPAPSAVVAYFRLPFHATTADDPVAYGLAITAPMPGSYSTESLSIANTPKLMDLRFNGARPDTLRVTGQFAWARDGSHLPEGQRLSLLGGIGSLALGIAGTALAVYGIYGLVKKKCPAISTTNGACIQAGN